MKAKYGTARRLKLSRLPASRVGSESRAFAASWTEVRYPVSVVGMLGRMAVGLLAFIFACGGTSQDRQSHALPISPQAPIASGLQDQRFVLEVISVAATGHTSPRSEAASSELHQIEQLQSAAYTGIKDARACRAHDVKGEQGTVVLSLELAASGVVIGGSVMPRGGSGLGAVADCLLARARAWTFPSRSVPGSTIVIANFLYGPRR